MKVLFVCHGNINRSPSAEIIAKKLQPQWEVKSCGLKTWAGRITAKNMRITLGERGYGAEGIRSSEITDELVEWADRIFYMDGGNERRFLARFGSLAKAQRLSDFVDGSDRIPDPTWCKDRSTHHRVISMIEEAVGKIGDTV